MSQEEKDDMENKDLEMIGGIIDENCNDKTEQTNDEDHLVNVIGCVTKQNCRQSTNEQFELVDYCINVINEKTSSTIFLDPSNVPKIELSFFSNKHKNQILAVTVPNRQFEKSKFPEKWAEARKKKPSR